MKPEFIIQIGPEHLETIGVGELWYELVNSAGNPSESFKRRLALDHTPVPENLKEATFTRYQPIWLSRIAQRILQYGRG